MVLVLASNGVLQNGGRIHLGELMEERFCLRLALQPGKENLCILILQLSALR